MVAVMYAGGALCALWALWRSWRLARVRQSPKGILGRGLGLGGMLALMGVVGVLPATVWFVWWMLVVVAVTATCVAAWRAMQDPDGAAGSRLAQAGTEHSGSERRSVEQSGPARWVIVSDGVLVVALIVVAFISG